MSSALVLGGMRKKVLGTAITLAVAGFTSLGLTTNGTDGPSPEFVAPTYGTDSPYPFESLLPSTTGTTGLERRRGLPRTGFGFFNTPSTGPGSTTTDPPQPTTQVDAAVPAAGAQVSFGQGPGSCTDVAITALTPDDCSPPPGDGPVVVDPDPTPSSDPLVPTPKAGFTQA